MRPDLACYLPGPMPEMVLAALWALVAEHQRSGELDGGLDNGSSEGACTTILRVGSPFPSPSKHTLPSGQSRLSRNTSVRCPFPVTLIFVPPS